MFERKFVYGEEEYFEMNYVCFNEYLGLGEKIAASLRKIQKKCI